MTMFELNWKTNSWWQMFSHGAMEAVICVATAATISYFLLKQPIHCDWIWFWSWKLIISIAAVLCIWNSWMRIGYRACLAYASENPCLCVYEISQIHEIESMAVGLLTTAPWRSAYNDKMIKSNCIDFFRVCSFYHMLKIPLRDCESFLIWFYISSMC